MEKTKQIEKKNIYQVLSEIQRNLKVPKSQRNEFGKYQYRSCEDIVESVKKILPEGYVLLLDDEVVLIGDRYYVKSTALLTNGEDDGIYKHAYARESLDKKGMDTAQITGATSSYARKYALNALLAIDDTKDADTQDNTKKEEKISEELINKVKSAMNEEELKKIWEEYKGLGKEFGKMVVEQKKFILSVQKDEQNG